MKWIGLVRATKEAFQAIETSLANLYAAYEGCEVFGRIASKVVNSRSAFSSDHSKESYRLLMEADMELSTLLEEFYGFNEVTYEMGKRPLRRPLRLYGEKDDFGYAPISETRAVDHPVFDN